MKNKVQKTILWLMLLTMFMGLIPLGQSSAHAATPRKFVDSAEREVKIPEELSQIAPSGPLAQIMLYTACADRLCGVAKQFSKAQQKLFPEKYADLLEFGQFYGKNASLNMEALLKAAPQLIVDIGEKKKSIKEDMDQLQEQLGIPCVFIEASLDTLPEAYEKLAELTGDKERCEKLAKAAKEILERSAKAKEEIKEADQVKVYWAMGEKGSNTNARESFQAEVLQKLPLINVADVEANSKGGGSEVSFEQILLWQPDVILVDNPSLLEEMKKDKIWEELKAFQDGKVYVIPQLPYGFLANPPSVNRLMGLDWLGSLLYPKQYEIEIKEELKDFYELFYQIELEDEQIEEILHPQPPKEDKGD